MCNLAGGCLLLLHLKSPPPLRPASPNAAPTVEPLYTQVLGDASRVRVLPLHGAMPTVNQREIFERPPEGIRKAPSPAPASGVTPAWPGLVWYGMV